MYELNETRPGEEYQASVPKQTKTKSPTVVNFYHKEVANALGEAFVRLK